ncbi:MAG: T9SS type A sorting domain-containing protein [Ignavibacteria bacterium]|jgi:hypothetical protein
MKTKLSLLFLISCFITVNFYSHLQAQDAPLGPAPKILEQSINKVPYNPLILPDILASTAYAQDGSTNVFESVPIPAGTPWTTIGPLATLSYGGVFANGNYYITTGSTNQLGTVNITTGVETIIGAISGVASGYTSTSLAWKQPSGPMYLGATNITTSNLYTVTLTSPVTATLVGTITNCPGLIDFSINCLNNLYGVDIVNDNLVSINTTTGAGTIVGPLGFNASYAQGGAFELSTGNLYLAAYNQTSGSAELRLANLTTGGTTLLISWSGHEPVAFGIPGTCGTTVPACDMQAGPFLSLPGLILPQNFYPIKARVTNVGSATQTNIPVKFFVNGAQYGSTLYIPTLAPGMSDTTAVFAWSPSASGLTPIAIATALACDSIRTNDTVKTTVNVGCASLFTDDFTGGDGNWNIVNNGGTCIWSVKPRTSRPYTMPPTAVGNVFSADVDQCGPSTTINSTATMINSINCTNKYNIYLEFDSDFYLLSADICKVDASYDGGSTWSNILNWTTNRRNTHEIVLMPAATNQAAVKVRFTSIQPAWDWWWAVDNITIHGCSLVGVPGNQSNIPDKYALSQNYPNPFNPATMITYALPKAGNVKLTVYDVLGREVKTLVNEYKTAGTYNVTFDGSSLSSGLYFYRINAGSFTDTKKMVLVK